MTASQIPFEAGAFTTPVVDYEPPPYDVAGGPAPPFDVAGGPAPPFDACPTPASLHRSSRRAQRQVPTHVAPPPAAPHVAPPPAAAAFADAVLRRVLEVIDRRRPIAALRPMLTPPLLDMVFTLNRAAGPDKAAVLRRVRLRTAAVDDRQPHQPTAAEVFATYTRGQRVRAIAGRIEVTDGRWRMVALQIG
ncbi:Rv3235 family protein [Mycolicibacterium stellerae]|uniref:Rv3235 family protein n=1 Tax=Mycolicibacterium stellerae TaxID=2358193 RepID=UPI000F0B6D12|nr:Rv3235 family protein [Mycolicibacterium stellerae]